MSQRSSVLVAYAVVNAATNNIPVTGTWYQPILLNPKGVAIPGNIIPSQVSLVSFHGTGFVLGVDYDAVPNFQAVAAAQPDALNVVLGGQGKKVAVTSSGAAITTGFFAIFFYA